MIIRVRRFGGGRHADPPAWGVKLAPDKVYIFAGVLDYLVGGPWWIDPKQHNSDTLFSDWWPVDESDMPDEVCAALAKWRLSQ